MAKSFSLHFFAWCVLKITSRGQAVLGPIQTESWFISLAGRCSEIFFSDVSSICDLIVNVKSTFAFRGRYMFTQKRGWKLAEMWTGDNCHFDPFKLSPCQTFTLSNFHSVTLSQAGGNIDRWQFSETDYAGNHGDYSKDCYGIGQISMNIDIDIDIYMNIHPVHWDLFQRRLWHQDNRSWSSPSGCLDL